MRIFSIARASSFSVMSIVCAARLAAAAPFAYVANDGFGTVSVIDVETKAVVATISLSAGSSPSRLAVSPDGMRVYVATGSALAVIDTATNTVTIPAIPVGFGTRSVALTPDGRFAYVAVQFDGRVAVVDTTANAVVASVVTGGQPTGLKVTPDGSRVYVADSLRGLLLAIDTATNSVVGPIVPVGMNPQDLEISRNGARVYVSNFNSATVSVIETASNTVEATIGVGFFPYGMDTTTDGRTLYVVADGSVAVIDTATDTLVGHVTLPAFHSPRDVAVIPGGTQAYVTINTPPQVLVFDTATNALVDDPILIENGIPDGIAMTSAAFIGTLPFSSFTATLNLRPNARYGLSAAGTFVLNNGSDGIEFNSDVVRLTLSSTQGIVLDQTLPAASFRAIAGGGGIFQSRNGDGDIQLIRIAPMHVRGAYSFQVLAEPPRLSDVSAKPITLSLQIGNDAGSTAMHCESGGAIKCQ